MERGVTAQPGVSLQWVWGECVQCGMSVDGVD